MSELLTTARPYAKALFKTAKDQNSLDEYFKILSDLSMVVNQTEVKNLLLNDSFDNKEKVKILSEIMKGSANENFVRFINLLIENNRLIVISEILNLYAVYLQEERSLKTAKINTAYELSNEQLESIKAALEKRFNKKVVVEQDIDTTLLAGAVVRVDDLVIDGSLKEQLRKLETQLIWQNRGKNNAT